MPRTQSPHQKFAVNRLAIRHPSSTCTLIGRATDKRSASFYDWKYCASTARIQYRLPRRRPSTILGTEIRSSIRHDAFVPHARYPECFILRCSLPQPSRPRRSRHAWLPSLGSSSALRRGAHGRYRRPCPNPHWRRPMLDLPSVTLCCVDTANPELALRALRASRSQ